MIGAQQCVNPHPDSSNDPQHRLVCTLPAGFGAYQPVRVLQQNGDISSTIALLSYQQCQPGFLDPGTIACVPCAKGKYTNVASQPVCSLCPAGTMAPNLGTSSCTKCNPGSFTS